jgi:hypothetical protein
MAEGFNALDALAFFYLILFSILVLSRMAGVAYGLGIPPFNDAR